MLAALQNQAASAQWQSERSNGAWRLQLLEVPQLLIAVPLSSPTCKACVQQFGVECAGVLEDSIVACCRSHS
jgi:hypothetical protein